MALYDTIGKNYSASRRADPRITSRIIDLLCLPPGSTVADIGAGTGNYSLQLALAGFRLIAIEPSVEMARQAKQHPLTQWILASAESIPLPAKSVSGCISILSYHHFQDRRTALAEMLRIAGEGPLLFLTFCPQRFSRFWLGRYFPTLLAEAWSCFQSAEETASEMARWSNRKPSLHWFALPGDLEDMFAAAGWSRPELYLEARVRAGISSFAKVSQLELTEGLRRLASDLSDGTWDEEFGELRRQANYDAGYVFIRLDP